jgi:23S rRNA (uracil1939-C5)-methyltransferase
MTLAQLATMMESGEPIMKQQQQSRIVEKTSYMIASATQAIRSGQALGANVMIVDPPRKGLDEEVLYELCKQYNPKQPYVESSTFLTIPDDKVNWCNDIRTLIYVSCGFEALARDCEKIVSSSAGWKIHSATGYVLFPGSDHVETVAIFQR